MEANEDEPNDVQKASPVEEEITRGEIDEHSGRPSLPIELAKKRHHCEKDSKKKIKKSLKNEGECCRVKLANAAKGHSKTATVLVYEKECTLPKIKPIPRHCLTKDEWIDLLATPSRKCPSPCLQREVTRKLRPVSARMAELAQPPKNRLLNTLQDRAATLPTELVDRLIQTLEGEACLTPEQAERMFRDKDIRGRKKCRKRKSHLLCNKGSSSKSHKREDPEIPVHTSSGFDKDAVNSQYMMAESFVKSILDWKCPIPKEEFKDIAEVILKRLGYVLEYNPINGEDRKSQQMRFLADVVASWISGVLFDVAAAQKEEMEKECERKRKEKEEESEESDDDSEDDDDNDDDDDDEGGRGGPPGDGRGHDDRSKKGRNGKKDDTDDDKRGGEPVKKMEEKKEDDTGKTKSDETLTADDKEEPTDLEQADESRPPIKDTKEIDKVDAREASGLNIDRKMTPDKKIDETIDFGSEDKDALRADVENESRGEAMINKTFVPGEIGAGRKIEDDSQAQNFGGVPERSEKEETLVTDDKDESKAPSEVTRKAAEIAKDGDEPNAVSEAEKEAIKILDDKEEAKKGNYDKGEDASAKTAAISKDGDAVKTANEAEKEAIKILDNKEEAKKGILAEKISAKTEEILAEDKVSEETSGETAAIPKIGDKVITSGEVAKETTAIVDDTYRKILDKIADKPKEISSEAETASQLAGKESHIELGDSNKKLKMPGDPRQEIPAEPSKGDEKTRVEIPAVDVSESRAEPEITEATPAAMIPNIPGEKILTDSAENVETMDDDKIAKQAQIDERATGDRKNDEIMAQKLKTPEALGSIETQSAEASPIVAEVIGKKIQEDATVSSTPKDSGRLFVLEKPEVKLKDDEKSRKEPSTLSEAQDKRETPRRKPSKIPSSVVAKRNNFETDQLVTVEKIFHTIYNAIEGSPENSGTDAITNRLHRVIYEKCSNVVEKEKNEPLTDLTKDVLDVLSGKLAICLKDVLTETQLSFIHKFPATVESIDVREWTKWITDVSDTANTWATWIQETSRKAESMGTGEITRGGWQDWTKSVETDALRWRRFYVQSLHEAHHNLTMIRDREVVKTGAKDVNETEMKITDLEVDH